MLGRDPSPGDPDRVDRTAEVFRSVSRDAKDARSRLQAISDSGIDTAWTGDAAKAFERSLRELCGDLDRLTNSYGEAGDALATYAAELRRCKADARQAETQAEAAQHDQEDFDRRHREATERSSAYAAQSRSAQVRVGSSRVQQTVSTAAGDIAGATTAQNRITQDLRISHEADAARSQADGDARYAATQADSARQRLLAARRLADQVAELQHHAGDAAAAKIDEAGKVAGKYHRGTFEAALQGFTDIVSSPEFDAFLTGLSQVGSLLTTVAPFVACIAPEAAGVLYAAGVTLTAAALLGRIAQAAVDHSKVGGVFEAGLDLGLALIGGGGSYAKTAKELPGLVKRLVSPADHGSHVVLNSAKLSGPLRSLTRGFHTADVPLRIQNIAHGTNFTATVRTVAARTYFTGQVLSSSVELVAKPIELVSEGRQVVADLTGHGQSEPDKLGEAAKNADRVAESWDFLAEKLVRAKK